MKQNILGVLLGMGVCLSILVGCQKSVVSETEQPQAVQGAQRQEDQDLTPSALPMQIEGLWKSAESNGGWLEATVSARDIEVQFVLENGNTRALYWRGSFALPEPGTNTFSYESKRDDALMERALFASQSETKKFTVENGFLRFEVTVQGVTKSFELTRVE